MSVEVQVTMPTKCLKTRASQELQRMEFARDSVLGRNGSTARPGGAKVDPRPTATRLEALWAEHRYDARAFGTSLARRAMDEARTQSERDRGGSGDEDVMVRDEGHGGRTAEVVAENNKWEKELRAAAYEEQVRKWGEEQEKYAASDGVMGAGEMAMWNTLHPAADGRLERCEWGALQQAQHIRSRTHKEVWLRVVAGCSRYTTVYAAKQGSYQEFRSPHTEEQRLAVLLCECGQGVQDSMHVLKCALADMVELRRKVVQTADACVCVWCGGSGRKALHGADRRARCKRARGSAVNITQRTEREEEGGQTGIGRRPAVSDRDAWAKATSEHKILTSLGSDCVGLSQGLRVRIISETAAHWGGVEEVYAQANDVDL